MYKGIYIKCIDGRLNEGRERALDLLNKLDYEIEQDGLYLITTSGPDGTLAGKYASCRLEAVRDDVTFVHENAGDHLGVIVLVGHTDCARHKVNDDEHKEDVRTGIRTISEWVNGAVPIVGLLDRLDKEAGEWRYELIEIVPAFTAEQDKSEMAA